MSAIDSQTQSFFSVDIIDEQWCPELPDLVNQFMDQHVNDYDQEVVSLMYLDRQPKALLLECAMATGKTYQLAQLASRPLKKWYTKYIVSQDGLFRDPSIWRQLLEGSLNAPRILSILPRKLCVINIHVALNGYIEEKIEFYLRECPEDIRPQLHDRLQTMLFFTSYLDLAKIPHNNVRACGRVITCMESVYKFIDNDFDMLFMDESESDLVNLTGTNLSGAGHTIMLQCANSIERCVQRATNLNNRKAGGVYCLDADASAKSLTFLMGLVDHKHIWIIRNTRPHAPLQHMFHLYFPSVNMPAKNKALLKRGERFETCKMAWFGRLQNSVAAGKRIFLVCTSKTMGYVLQKMIKIWRSAIRVRYINADIDDTDKLALVNLDKEFRDFDVVIMTSVITVGTDFQLEHFDEIFCYACAMSCDFETNFQMLGRIRKLKHKSVYMLLDRRSTTDAHTNIKDVKEVHECKVHVLKLLEGERMKRTNGKSSDCAPDWLRNVYHYNKLQDNLSKKDYVISVLKHLIRKSCPWAFPLTSTTTKKKVRIFNEMLQQLKVCETEADVYEDDEKFPMDIKLLEKELKGHLLTEMEKHHMQKIKFLRDYVKKPSFEEYQGYKKNKEVKRVIDTEALIDAGIGPKQMFEQNENHVFLPSQELQPIHTSVRHKVMQRLLGIFDIELKDIKNKPQLHHGHILSSLPAFEAACAQAATMFNVPFPQTFDWNSSKAFLDDVLYKFDCLQLQFYCQRPECKEFKKRGACSDQNHRAKVSIQGDNPRRMNVHLYRIVRSRKISEEAALHVKGLQKKRKQPEIVEKTVKRPKVQ